MTPRDLLARLVRGSVLVLDDVGSVERRIETIPHVLGVVRPEHEDDALSTQQTRDGGIDQTESARRAPSSAPAPSKRKAGATGTE
jgi:hypothetical protein